MSERAVCDASALVAALLDAGPDGQWATSMLGNAAFAAPSLVDYEVATIIRRHERTSALA